MIDLGRVFISAIMVVPVVVNPEIVSKRILVYDDIDWLSA
jgi:hypothetical protein